MTNNPLSLAGRPVVIGGGIAGLMTALSIAPEPVVLMSKSAFGAEASSVWAQGGVAAAIGSDDSIDLHVADTLAAGAGLCDPEAVLHILQAAPDAIERLARLGVAFDRHADGTFQLGLEAAHSRHRIVHAHGDGTGREIMRALVAAAQANPAITLLEDAEARRLLVEDNHITGIVAAGPQGSFTIDTARVVIATGGLGGLFLDSTNPSGCFGQGLALAAYAGAALRDLEFVQFHPTALDGPSRPMPLVSEAVRGAGAILIDETGNRFMAGQPGAELAPRDIVARAVWRHRAAGHRVFLDARHTPGAGFARQFPVIDALCKRAGVDPATDPIPIRPAAHYHMGGITVDHWGRSSVDGLWACGEAASTGLHGANRLASNSLIEAVVCGQRVAEDVAGTITRTVKPRFSPGVPPAPDPTLVRPIVSRGLGLERERESLEQAISALLPLARHGGAAAAPAAVGLMMAVAALRRSESRGAHSRSDSPSTAATAQHSSIVLADAFDAARAVAPEPTLLKRAQS